MLNKHIARIGLSIFLIIALLLFFNSTLNAEIENKTKGINKALAEAKITAKTEGQAKSEFHHKMDSYLRYIPSRKVDAQSGKVGIIDSDALS